MEDSRTKSPLRTGTEKLPEKEIKERVDNIIKLMGLEEFHNSYPHQLSVSTEQRIIIGEEHCHEP